MNSTIQNDVAKTMLGVSCGFAALRELRMDQAAPILITQRVIPIKARSQGVAVISLATMPSQGNSAVIKMTAGFNDNLGAPSIAAKLQACSDDSF